MESTKYRQKRDAEYAALGITDEPSVMSGKDFAPKKKKTHYHKNMPPVTYVSTKKPRTVNPGNKTNWPGNISKSKKAHSQGVPLFSLELMTKFCERMCNGEAPTQICKDPTMPSYPTLMRWYTSDDPQYDAFKVMYEESQKIMWFYHADQLIQISDDSSNDYMDRYNKFTDENERVLDPENVQRSRLRVDTRKFLLAKMLPKIFGEKMDISVGGRDGKPITVAAINMSVEEAERAYMDMINGTTPAKQLKKD
jgi:hypothetical protein